jgi:hypothetical protein
LSRNLLSDLRVVVPGVVPSHVTFEFLGVDGEWSACIRNENTESRSISGRPVTNTVLPESLLSDTGHHSDQQYNTLSVGPTDPIPDPAIDLACVETGQNLNMSDIDFTLDSWLDLQLVSAPEIERQSTFEMNYSVNSTGILDIVDFYSKALDDLPSKRFEIDLKATGMCQYPSLHRSETVLMS